MNGLFFEEETYPFKIQKYHPIPPKAILLLLKQGKITLPITSDQEQALELLRYVWSEKVFLRFQLAELEKKERLLLAEYPRYGKVDRYLAGSLKLGKVPATGIMRTLQVGDRPTQLALALAEFGRIEKTLHFLNYINDENKRRATLLQLNHGEGRHSLGRDVFHGKRGELRKRYREGQEDQLSALGLVLNVIVL